MKIKQDSGYAAGKPITDLGNSFERQRSIGVFVVLVPFVSAVD
jgi:hypothetical protein